MSTKSTLFTSSSPPPVELQAITAAIDQALIEAETVESFFIQANCNPGRFVIIYDYLDEVETEITLFNVTNFTFVPSSPGVYYVYCDDKYPEPNTNPDVIQVLATTGIDPNNPEILQTLQILMFI